jgi:hypothetical protein
MRSASSARPPPCVAAGRRADLLALLGGPADKLPGWVSWAPQMRLEGGAAKRLRVARGAPKTSILTDRSGILVALAYEHTTAWFLSRDIPSGHVLMVDEKDAAVAVTGVLPDGPREASISTRERARTLRTVDGVYSERLRHGGGPLPRLLTFTDARGKRTVPIPLSSDLAN